MQSLAKAVEPSGWMMWPVLAQSHSWTIVPSLDGATTTVGMQKMQEWCAKVGRRVVYMYCICAVVQRNIHRIGRRGQRFDQYAILKNAESRRMGREGW